MKVIAEDVSYELNAENLIYAKAVLEEQRQLTKIIKFSIHYSKRDNN